MKRALVTSSTKGIGKAIGLKLLKEGYYVYFNFAHDEEAARELINEIDVSRYSIIKADMSDPNERIFLPELDVVVLNTGITNYNERISLDEWNKVLSTNLTIPYFLLRGLKMNIGASIIFIGALLGEVPHGRSIAYSVSKAGLHMLAKCLVKEYKGCTVNTIAVGFADTEWHNNKDAAHLKRIVDKIAAGRLGKPAEIAELAYHLTINKYINGATINIDGGYDML